MPKKLRKEPVNYSEIFDHTMADVDYNIDQAVKDIVDKYSLAWGMDTMAANDIVNDNNLTAVTILDCLNTLLEISEQNRDFRRAVVILKAKVKKHQTLDREKRLGDDEIFDNYDVESDE